MCSKIERVRDSFLRSALFWFGFMFGNNRFGRSTFWNWYLPMFFSIRKQKIWFRAILWKKNQLFFTVEKNRSVSGELPQFSQLPSSDGPGKAVCFRFLLFLFYFATILLFGTDTELFEERKAGNRFKKLQTLSVYNRN